MDLETPQVRSFIAIPLPAGIQQQLGALQQRLKKALPELKPAPPHNLHLTLQFLGDRSAEQLAELGRVVLSTGRTIKKFNLDIARLGAFPNLRRPRVLWLGLHPPEPLLQLHGELARQLDALGLLDDRRPYRPHLTIGRCRTAPAQPDALRPFLSQQCGRLQVTELVLYGSRLTPQGAIHTPLTRAGLSGG